MSLFYSAGLAGATADEGFEHNDLSGEYGGDTGKYNIQTNFVASGTHALESTGTSRSVPEIVNDSLSHGQDTTTTVKVATDTVDFVHEYLYAAQSVGGDPNAYKVSIDYGGGPAISLVDTASGTTLGSDTFSSSPSTNTFHTLEIEWLANDTHTISFTNSAGTELASFTVTDSTYTSGKIGFSYDIGDPITFFWDNINITAV